MDQNRFAIWTRAMTDVPSRRDIFRGLVGAGLGLGAARLPDAVAARKKRKRKVKLNTFGCIDVGGFCKTADQCCSGICRGKPGKKKCRAHDIGTVNNGGGGCPPGVQDDSCDETGGTDIRCTTSTGYTEGYCGTTTGNGGYCLNAGGCFPCTKDAECQEFCGPGPPASAAMTARKPAAPPAPIPRPMACATPRRSSRWQSGQQRHDPGFPCHHPDLAPGEVLLERNDS